VTGSLVATGTPDAGVDGVGLAGARNCESSIVVLVRDAGGALEDAGLGSCGDAGARSGESSIVVPVRDADGGGEVGEDEAGGDEIRDEARVIE
jgi:hypothetical protein